MEKRFLDETGLTHLIDKIKTELNSRVQLDNTGKIPSGLLPGSINNVVEFSGFVDDAEIQKASFAGTAYTVVYVVEKKRFAAQTGLTQNQTYFGNWRTRDNYLDSDENPFSGKIYIDVESNSGYRWNGSELVGMSLSVGSISIDEINGVLTQEGIKK